MRASGIDLPELLVASHIKPWRDSSDRERLDSCNGLLLATHIDKAFDRYLLSFKEDSDEFQVSIHPRAAKTLSSLDVKANARLKLPALNLTDSARFASYVRQHFDIHAKLVARDRPS
ncbi:MAG: HNH endonuclease [Usitatibacteraceae bacterium]